MPKPFLQGGQILVESNVYRILGRWIGVRRILRKNVAARKHAGGHCADKRYGQTIRKYRVEIPEQPELAGSGLLAYEGQEWRVDGDRVVNTAAHIAIGDDVVGQGVAQNECRPRLRRSADRCRGAASRAHGPQLRSIRNRDARR